MLAGVLATLYESLTVADADHADQQICRRNPVTRLTAVAMTMDPLALASDGVSVRGG